MSDLLHVLVAIHEVHRLHAMTTGAHEDGVSPSLLQERRLVGERRCPGTLPAAIAAAAAVAATVVAAAAVVAGARRARPYVYDHDCVHNHVQTEALRR